MRINKKETSKRKKKGKAKKQKTKEKNKEKNKKLAALLEQIEALKDKCIKVI